MCFAFSVHAISEALMFPERENNVCSSNLCNYFSDGLSLLKRLVAPVSSTQRVETA